MKTGFPKYCFFLLFVSTFLSCNIQQRKITLSKVILDLPSAINEPASRYDRKASETSAILSTLKYLYDPIREEFTPMAFEATEYAKSILNQIDETIFHNRLIMRSIINDNSFEQTFIDDNGTESMIRVTREDTSYEVDLWQKSASEWLKVLNVSFTADRDIYSGTLYIRKPSQTPEENILYKIVFNTADTCGHSLELSAINLEYSEGDGLSENIPDRLWIKICKNLNKFYISANIHYLNVNLNNGSEFDDYVMDRIYDGTYIPGTTVVNANYIYSGAVNLLNGNGAVSLALVPETDNSSSEVFDTYSIGNIFKEAIAEWTREATDPESEKTVVRIINEILTQAGESLISADSDTDAIFTALGQVLEYLETRGSTDSSILKGMLFVVKLVNPGYFEKDTGFIGNDLLSTPAWADLVPDFDDFPVKSAIAVSGDSFLFEMPNDNPPDP